MSKQDRIQKTARKKLKDYIELRDTLGDRISAIENEIIQLETAKLHLLIEQDNIRDIIEVYYYELDY